MEANDKGIVTTPSSIKTERILDHLKVVYKIHILGG